jgi:hypothetical protein
MISDSKYVRICFLTIEWYLYVKKHLVRAVSAWLSETWLEQKFNGTLYFWDHFGGQTHILNQYIGGYSSYTLQLKNIVPINPELNVPNIRNDFVVTDKADGDRHLLFINDKGKIYLINTNMNKFLKLIAVYFL